MPGIHWEPRATPLQKGADPNTIRSAARSWSAPALWRFRLACGNKTNRESASGLAPSKTLARSRPLPDLPMLVVDAARCLRAILRLELRQIPLDFPARAAGHSRRDVA